MNFKDIMLHEKKDTIVQILYDSSHMSGQIHRNRKLEEGEGSEVPSANGQRASFRGQDKALGMDGVISAQQCAHLTPQKQTLQND